MCRRRLKCSQLGVWSQLLVTFVVMGAQAYMETGQYISDLDQPVPIASVQGVLGKKAALPCDIQSLAADDHVSMVLWFKEADGEPLYSYDVRGRLASQPKLWSSPSVFGSRAFFRATAAPAVLLVDPVMSADAGVYRCRVDFKNAPTRNMRLNFTVITPPHRPNILDAKTRDATKLLEPYNEGDTLNLICEVNGGDPPPRVHWYLENTVIDDSFEQRADGVTLNSLTFPNVGRQHLNARLICQASNTNLAPPQNKVLIMDVNLRPLSVQILNKSLQLSADRSYEVDCKASGSRPGAIITWWKGDKQLKRGVKNFSESNSTLSLLTLVPEAEDHGRSLACRAHNPRIPDAVLEDTWMLNVHFIPVVTLKVGPNLNPDLIKETDDVYFECSVSSNPRSHKLTWYKGDKEIQHNPSLGVILSDQSLVLQRVSRAAAGDYSCAASNSEGTGNSNPVTLQVRYVPICKTVSEGAVYGALKHETVSLRCEVDASPPPSAFLWSFNNNGEQTEVPSSSYTSHEFTSTLNYTPSRDVDFGVISCLAHNAVGEQITPCRYRLVPASPPVSLHNCTILKQDSPELEVACTEGFDGGLPQTFYMEILELPFLILRLNLSSTTPYFNVSSLDSRAYSLRLYSANAKGRSSPVELYTVSAAPPDKYTGRTSSPLSLSPVLAGLAALAALLAAAVCGVITALYRRRRGCGRHRARGTKQPPAMDSLYPEHSLESLSVKHDNAYSLSPSLEYCRFEKDQESNGLEENKEPDIISGNYDKIPPLIESNKLKRSMYDDVKPSNLYIENCDYNHQVCNAQGSQVSRGVTARGADIFTSTRHPPQVVTSSRRVKESCI